MPVETGGSAGLELPVTQPAGSGDPGGLISFASQKLFEDPEQLITAYFSASTVALCIVDIEFRFLAVNRTMAEISGLNLEAHLGKTMREVLGELADKADRLCAPGGGYLVALAGPGGSAGEVARLDKRMALSRRAADQNQSPDAQQNETCRLGHRDGIDDRDGRCALV